MVIDQDEGVWMRFGHSAAHYSALAIKQPPSGVDVTKKRTKACLGHFIRESCQAAMNRPNKYTVEGFLV